MSDPSFFESYSSSSQNAPNGGRSTQTATRHTQIYAFSSKSYAKIKPSFSCDRPVKATTAILSDRPISDG